MYSRISCRLPVSASAMSPSLRPPAPAQGLPASVVRRHLVPALLWRRAPEDPEHQFVKWYCRRRPKANTCSSSDLGTLPPPAPPVRRGLRATASVLHPPARLPPHGQPPAAPILEDRDPASRPGSDRSGSPVHRTP